MCLFNEVSLSRGFFSIDITFTGAKNIVRDSEDFATSKFKGTEDYRFGNFYNDINSQVICILQKLLVITRLIP